MTPLLDTHQHLVYRDKAGYSWTAGLPALANQDFTLANYKSLTKDLGVAATIFMETRVDDKDCRLENDFAMDISDEPDSGIIGMISTCRPESDEDFEEWLDYCEVMGVVGYRRILHVVSDDISRAKLFRDNIRMIGERDMVFDMCFLQRQLPLALELAKVCDNTRLVLDHCGVPDIAGGDIVSWRSGIDALAALPNVYCKLSGLLAYCPPGKATLGTIRPYVDHVLEKFGPNRVVWGSDWPVVNQAKGVADWIAVTREIIAQLSEDESAAIAHATAEEVYMVSMPGEID